MSEEVQHGPTGAGAVIADIGGGRGALALYFPKTMAGAEIEISPQDSGVRTHVAVLERRLADRTLFAAFYHSLDAGDHTVWDPDGSAAGIVTITSGAVTEADAVTDAHGCLVVTARPRGAIATTPPIDSPWAQGG